MAGIKQNIKMIFNPFEKFNEKRLPMAKEVLKIITASILHGNWMVCKIVTFSQIKSDFGCIKKVDPRKTKNRNIRIIDFSRSFFQIKKAKIRVKILPAQCSQPI